MSVNKIQESVDGITNDLKSLEERREKLINGTRDVILLCSKSIVALHNGKYEEAFELADKAKVLLDDLRHFAKVDLYRYLISAETEFVEANALQAIISGSNIPSIETLHVHDNSYILGLLDCVGELKRLIYDQIRKGKSDDARNLFDLMEQIYIMLSPLAIYDNIVQGVRRKLDVARKLIEDTRAVITEDSRRLTLLESIDRLHNKLSERSLE